jgi:hypothetical protein
VNPHRRNATHKHLIEPSSFLQKKLVWDFERKTEESQVAHLRPIGYTAPSPCLC